MICALDQEQIVGFQKYLGYKIKNFNIDSDNLSKRQVFESFLTSIADELKTTKQPGEKIALHMAIAPSLLINISESMGGILGFDNNSAKSYLEKLNEAYNPLAPENAETAYLQILSDYSLEPAEKVQNRIEEMNKQFAIQKLRSFDISETATPKVPVDNSRDFPNSEVNIYFESDAPSEAYTDDERYNLIKEELVFNYAAKRFIIVQQSDDGILEFKDPTTFTDKKGLKYKFDLHENLDSNKFNLSGTVPGDLVFYPIDLQGEPWQFSMNSFGNVSYSSDGITPVFKARVKISTNSMEAKSNSIQRNTKVDKNKTDSEVAKEVQAHEKLMQLVKEQVSSGKEVTADPGIYSSLGTIGMNFDNPIVRSSELKSNSNTILYQVETSGPLSGFVSGTINKVKIPQQFFERFPIKDGMNHFGQSFMDVKNTLFQQLRNEPTENNVDLLSAFLGLSYIKGEYDINIKDGLLYFLENGNENISVLDVLSNIDKVEEIVDKALNGEMFIRSRTIEKADEYSYLRGDKKTETGFEKKRINGVELTKEPLKVNIPTQGLVDLVIENGKVIQKNIIGLDYQKFVLNNTGLRVKPAVDGKVRLLNAYVSFNPASINLAPNIKSAEIFESDTELTNAEVLLESNQIAPKQEQQDQDNTQNEISANSSTKSYISPDIQNLLDEEEENTLFKNVFVQEVESTPEQDAAAVSWFNSSGLKKAGIKLEDARAFVSSSNPNGIAKFSDWTITLMNGSSLSDIYHEAYHAYSMHFLSEKERNKLYGEVRERSGSVKTFKGETKNYSELTDLETEEILAEGFREYMLTGKVKEKGPESWFKKLLNIIKAFFGQSQVDVEQTYKSLRDNNYSGPVTQSARFATLYKSIVYIDKDTKEKIIVDENISNSIVQMIDNAFAEFIKPDTNTDNLERQNKILVLSKEMQRIKSLPNYSTNSVAQKDVAKIQSLIRTLSLLTGKESYEIGSKDFFTKGYEFAQSYLISNLTKLAETKPAAREALDIVEKYFFDVDTLGTKDYSKSRFGIIGTHIQKSSIFASSLIDKSFELEDKLEEEAQETGVSSYGDRSGAEISAVDRVKPRIKILLNLIKSEDNQIQPADTLFNRILRETEDLSSREQYAKYLKSFKEGQDILNIIGPDFNNMSRYHELLWSDFMSSFDVSLSPIENVQMIVSTDANTMKETTTVYIQSGSEDSAKVRDNVRSYIQSSKHPYTKFDKVKNKNFVDISKLLSESEEDVFNLLKLFIEGGIKSLGKLSSRDEQKLFSDLTNLVGYIQEIPTSAAIEDLYSLSEANSSKKKNIRKLVNNISTIIARYGVQDKTTMSKKADGNPQSDYMLPNSTLKIIQMFNNPDVRTFADLMKNPVTNRKFNPGANPSKIPLLTKLFPGIIIENGVVMNPQVLKSGRITQTTIGGLGSKKELSIDTEGEDSSALSEDAKVEHDIMLSLIDNKYEIPRIADKKPTYVIQFESENSSMFLENNDVKDKTLSQIVSQFAKQFIPHIQAELQRIATIKAYQEAGDAVNPLDKGYVQRGQEMFTFRGMLSDQTIKLLVSPSSVENPIVQENIKEDLMRYFESKYKTVYAKHLQPKGFYNSFGEMTYKESTLSTFIQSYNLTPEQAIYKFMGNYVINALNTLALVHNDSAFFDPFNDAYYKRNAGGTSTGTSMDYSDSVLAQLNRSDQEWYTVEGIAPPIARETYRAAIIEEPKFSMPEEELETMKKNLIDTGSSESEAEEVIGQYRKMDIADAQGYISFNAWKKFMIMNGAWTPEISSFFNKEIKGLNSKEDGAKFFKILKMQYYGDIMSGPLNQTAFHKYSLLPLIPSMIKNTPLEQLHKNMMKSGVDYITPESGSKLANPIINSSVDVFDEFNSETTLEDKIKSSEYHFVYLKNQLETGNKFKGVVSMQTQMTKLIKSSFFSEGDIIDPQYKNIIESYNSSIYEYQQFLVEKMLKDYGLDGKISTKVPKSVIDVIEKDLEGEGNSLELGELERLRNLKDGEKIHIESLMIGQRIQKIIFNKVQKLTKFKLKGEGLIQVSNYGFTNATKEQNTKWQADLPFYSLGKAAKCKIAMQGEYLKLLKHYAVVSSENPLEELNKILKSEELLDKYPEIKDAVKLTGARIPTQGENSMELMEVFEFLPQGTPNIIVVPAGMVTKSGSDFDVDKLTMLMKSFYLVGDRIIIPYTEQDIEAIQAPYKALKQQLNTILSKRSEYFKVKNYIDQLQAELDELNKENTSDEKTYQQTFLKEELITQRAILRTLSKTKEDVQEDNREIEELNARILEEKMAIKDIKKFSLQNNIQKSMADILLSPRVFPYLVRPNTTKDTKEAIADPIKKKNIKTTNVFGEERPSSTKKGVTSYGEGSSIIDPTESLRKHQENSIGKTALGIVAVANPQHALYKEAGIHLQKGVNMYFDNVRKDSEGRITLSHGLNNDGVEINEYISQFINGTVDVAKDAWVFYLKGNTIMMPLVLTMIRMGIPLEETVLFLSSSNARKYEKLVKNTMSPRERINKNRSSKTIAKFISTEYFKKVIEIKEFKDYYTTVFEKSKTNFQVDAVRQLLDNFKDDNRLKELKESFKLFQLVELSSEILDLQTRSTPDTSITNSFVREVNVQKKVGYAYLSNDSLDRIKTTTIRPFYIFPQKSNILSNFGTISFDTQLISMIEKANTGEVFKKANIVSNDIDATQKVLDLIPFALYQRALRGTSSKPNYRGLSMKLMKSDDVSFKGKRNGDDIEVNENYTDEVIKQGYMDSPIMKVNYIMNLIDVEEEYKDIQISEIGKKRIASLRTMSPETLFGIKNSNLTFVSFFMKMKNIPEIDNLLNKYEFYKNLSYTSNIGVEMLQFTNSNILSGEAGVDFQNRMIEEFTELSKNLDTKGLSPTNEKITREFLSLLPFVASLQTSKTRGDKSIQRVFYNPQITEIKNESIDKFSKSSNRDKLKFIYNFNYNSVENVASDSGRRNFGESFVKDFKLLDRDLETIEMVLQNIESESQEAQKLSDIEAVETQIDNLLNERSKVLNERTDGLTDEQYENISKEYDEKISNLQQVNTSENTQEFKTKINQFNYTYNPVTNEVIHNAKSGDKVETNNTQINKVLVQYALANNFEQRTFNNSTYIKINDKVLNIKTASGVSSKTWESANQNSITQQQTSTQKTENEINSEIENANKLVVYSTKNKQQVNSTPMSLKYINLLSEKNITDGLSEQEFLSLSPAEQQEAIESIEKC